MLPDFGAIVRRRVTNEVNKRVDEKKQKAQDKLRTSCKGLLNK